MNRKEKKKRMKARYKVLIVVAIIVAAYLVLVNVLLTAALVPEFMRKLPAFENITEKCYGEMVQSDEIDANLAYGTPIFLQWLEEHEFLEINATTDDGYNLVASRLVAEDPASHKWVLVLHGYTGWKESMYAYAKMFYMHGYHAVIPDLRCQGSSEGDFIGMGWTDHYDCMKWLDYILSEDPDAEIVIFGQSMGAATALMMTGEEFLPEQVKAVVSDCAYTDGYSMFGDKLTEWFHLPPFPIIDTAVLMLRLRGGYNLHDASALEAVKKSHTPTLFIHGDQDAMISVDMAYELYDAEAADKRLLIVEGAGHAQAKTVDPNGFTETVFEFLAPYVE